MVKIKKTNFRDGDRTILVSFFLRAGLAIVFLYAAISSLLQPTSWIGYIPVFVQKIIPANIFLFIHSSAEFILALWILSNKEEYYAALISAVAMLFIILFNLYALDIVFRDIAIMFSAIALALLSYGKDK